jgi:hypothetical protein
MHQLKSSLDPLLVYNLRSILGYADSNYERDFSAIIFILI